MCKLTIKIRAFMSIFNSGRFRPALRAYLDHQISDSGDESIQRHDRICLSA